MPANVCLHQFTVVDVLDRQLKAMKPCSSNGPLNSAATQELKMRLSTRRPESQTKLLDSPCTCGTTIKWCQWPLCCVRQRAEFAYLWSTHHRICASRVTLLLASPPSPNACSIRGKDSVVFTPI